MCIVMIWAASDIGLTPPKQEFVAQGGGVVSVTTKFDSSSLHFYDNYCGGDYVEG